MGSSAVASPIPLLSSPARRQSQISQCQPVSVVTAGKQAAKQTGCRVVCERPLMSLEGRMRGALDVSVAILSLRFEVETGWLDALLVAVGMDC